MATIRYYLANSVVDGWQLLTETAQGAATLTAGWVVGTGATFSSEHNSGAATDRASTTFVANTVPDATLDTSLKDAFRTPLLNGSFASANWSFQFAVQSTVQSGAAGGQIVLRLIRADLDGSNAVEITAAQQAASVATLITTTDKNSTLTLNPGAFTITNQYLFVQIAWKRTVAGGMTTTNVRLRTGVSATVGTTILTADFTAAVVRSATLTQTTANATVDAQSAVTPIAFGTVVQTLDPATVSADTDVTAGATVTQTLGGTTAVAVSESLVTAELAGGPAGNNYQTQILVDGAVGYWPLDDPSGTTARDLAGTRHGTIVGNMLLDQPGAGDGKAMYFDEVSTWITLPSLPSFQPAFTWEVWFKVVVSLASAHFFGRYWFGANGFSYDLTGNAPRIRLPDGGTLVAGSVLTTGVWHHVVVIGNGTTASIYTDGVLSSTGAFVLPADPGTGEAAIGMLPLPSPNGIFNGLMQDVAIYPYVLTPAQIAEHFALRTAPTLAGGYPLAEATLIATGGVPLVDRLAVVNQTLLQATVVSTAGVLAVRTGTLVQTTAPATVAAPSTILASATVGQVLLAASMASTMQAQAGATVVRTLASVGIVATGQHGREAMIARTLDPASVLGTVQLIAGATVGVLLANAVLDATGLRIEESSEVSANTFMWLT